MVDTALYPGTFDPITLGHLDLIKRARKIFGRLVVAVADNPEKNPLFTVAERIEIIQEVTSDMDGVTVTSFSDLTARFAKSIKAAVIIRGLRAVSDFEFEMQMALMNRRLDNTIETVYLMPSEEYSFITSTIVKEAASYGGDVSSLVPGVVVAKLKKRFGR